MNLEKPVVSESPSTSWFKSLNRLASEKEILILFIQGSSGATSTLAIGTLITLVDAEFATSLSLMLC